MIHSLVSSQWKGTMHREIATLVGFASSFRAAMRQRTDQPSQPPLAVSKFTLATATSTVRGIYST